MLCGHLRRRFYHDIYWAVCKSSQLIILAASWHGIIRLDTSYRLSAIAARLSAAKTINLDLVRQMKEAAE